MLTELWDLNLSLTILAYSANIYFMKADNRNNRKRCEMCSKVTVKTSERCQWCHLVFSLSMSKLNIFHTFSNVSIVHFEHQIVNGTGLWIYTTVLGFMDTIWICKHFTHINLPMTWSKTIKVSKEDKGNCSKTIYVVICLKLSASRGDSPYF